MGRQPGLFKTRVQFRDKPAGLRVQPFLQGGALFLQVV